MNNDWNEIIERINSDYDRRLRKYNQYVKDLERQREEFYTTNPDFHYKSMFMLVIAPPQKIEIKLI